jgi:hypothetical protein
VQAASAAVTRLPSCAGGVKQQVSSVTKCGACNSSNEAAHLSRVGVPADGSRQHGEGGGGVGEGGSQRGHRLQARLPLQGGQPEQAPCKGERHTLWLQTQQVRGAVVITTCLFSFQNNA